MMDFILGILSGLVVMSLYAYWKPFAHWYFGRGWQCRKCGSWDTSLVVGMKFVYGIRTYHCHRLGCGEVTQVPSNEEIRKRRLKSGAAS